MVWLEWGKKESQPESKVWNQACRFGGDGESTVVPLKVALTKACFCNCLQKDYHFEYTECDSSGSRWRVAIPNSAVDCSGLPDPVRGKECSTFPFLTICFPDLTIPPSYQPISVNCNDYETFGKKDHVALVSSKAKSSVFLNTGNSKGY